MDIYEKIMDLKHNNRPFAVATVIKTGGSVPGKTGFKMLVEADGQISGTVGGGEIEKRAADECLRRLAGGSSGVQDYILQEQVSGPEKKGGAEVVPMMCNGTVSIFYEIIKQHTPVYIFGGGHVGQALSYLLARLDYRTTIVDNREEFAGEARNPYAHQRVFSDYVPFAQEFSPSPEAFVIIMTQGHSYDYEILKTLYQRKLRLKYIGVIASRAKAAGLLKNLRKDFGEGVDISSFYAPVGLDIGGNTESEIALSIAAEMQTVQFAKNGPHLRDK